LQSAEQAIISCFLRDASIGKVLPGGSTEERLARDATAARGHHLALAPVCRPTSKDGINAVGLNSGPNHRPRK